MKPKLNEKLTLVSTGPGVYLMKDQKGRIIYAGKAKNLKKRLKSYFKPLDQLNIKTRMLVQKIADIETLITASETEALMLESNLIKKHQPRYNVILKDDKRYPWLRLNIKEKYPGIEIVRNVKKDGAMYFGPFTSSRAMYETLKLINKTFKLRKCKTRVFKSRSRPCLNYQMGGCLGPCCLSVDADIYKAMLKEVILFLKGKTPQLIKNIKEKMQQAADAQYFEKAAEFRDKVFALKKSLEKQAVLLTDLKDRDVLALARDEMHALIVLMRVREGYLTGSRSFAFSQALGEDEDVLENFMCQYYDQHQFIPKEILISAQLENASLIEEKLGRIKESKIRILKPRRGEKVRLIQMALKNAYDELRREKQASLSNAQILSALKNRLNLKNLPKRIECFDNSHLSGTLPVSAMVVFENTKPLKSAYRKYHLKNQQKSDDYDYMAQVLKRRYAKGSPPDLLVVDGGKGQLNIALAVLKDLGLNFPVIGIAKKEDEESEDKIYLPKRANPVNWGRDKAALMFLQRVRDDAHRFVIGFQRKSRGKAVLISALDKIDGIGPKRRKTLLNHFGSVKKIRAATADEIAALPGIHLKLAEAILEMLQKN